MVSVLIIMLNWCCFIFMPKKCINSEFRVNNNISKLKTRLLLTTAMRKIELENFLLDGRCVIFLYTCE